MVTISTHGIAPAIYPKLPYDPLKDFAPITNVGLTPQVLMASLKSGITSVQDLIAKAKAGADLNYGSSGNGSASHLAVEHAAKRGRHQAHARAVQGQRRRADWRCRAATSSSCPTPIPGAVGPINAGKVKALGIADQRARPSCPTCRPSPSRASQGVVAVGWIGLSAPARTPEPILDRLSAEVMQILKEPEVLEKLKSLAFVPAERIAPGVRGLHRARERQMEQDRPGRRREDRVRARALLVLSLAQHDGGLRGPPLRNS